MAHRKALDIDAARPRVGESLDPVRGEDEIEIEGAVLQLDEVLAPQDLRRLRVGEIEAELANRRYERCSVVGAALDEQICVLGRVREPQEDGARLPDE